MSVDSPPLSCVHAARCPGCPLLALSYGEQLLRKRDLLRQALAGYPALAASEVTATRPAEPITGYRLRAKLVVDGTALGLYAEGTHDVVDIPQCQVLAPRVARVVAHVRAALPLAVPLLALDVRDADDGALVTLIVPRRTDARAARRAAEALMADCSDILGVALAEREVHSPQVLGAAPVPLLGATFARQRFADDAPWHCAVPGGFVQSHRAQTGALHAAIEAALRAALGDLHGRHILELYAGEGALALRLAARGALVTVADSFAANLAQLDRSAALQGLHVTTVAATAEAALARLATPDAILVDPPRRGLSPDVRAALGRLRPALVVYVSCEPKTLARDLAHLRELGLEPDEITPWDMIPLSRSVETLALLRPGRPAALRVLYEDDALLAIDKPAHRSLSGNGADSMLAAVRERPGFSDAVLLRALDAESSGVCLFARTARDAESWSNSVSAETASYSLLARGIVHKKGRIARPLSESRSRGEAVTRYQRDAVVGTHSLVRALLEHEQPQQIQRHFAHIGHPLLGDARYGDPATNRFFEQRYGLDRLFLHCVERQFTLRGAPLVLTSPLAFDLERVALELKATRGEKPATLRK